MVRVPNGVTLGINDLDVVEGADIKITPEEMGFEMGEFIIVA